MTDYVHGEMNIQAQERTFHGFVKFSVWGCIFCAVVLVALAAFVL